MHQLRQIGGGIAENGTYITWEVKKCPSCSRLVKETYECKVISEKEAHKLERELAHDIIPVEDDN